MKPEQNVYQFHFCSQKVLIIQAALLAMIERGGDGFEFCDIDAVLENMRGEIEFQQLKNDMVKYDYKNILDSGDVPWAEPVEL